MPEKQFTVKWEIQVSAENPFEAALKVWKKYFKNDHTACCFTVKDFDNPRYPKKQIDLTHHVDDCGETKILAIYDNGGETFDRYTVVYDNEWHIKTGHEEDKLYECLSMSENPTHPQGVGQHSSCQNGDHLGKKITFEELPLKCKEVVNKELESMIDTLIDKLDNETDSISLIWSIEDVLHQAAEDGKSINKDQARAVLAEVQKNHDCSLGVSWDTISITIDMVCGS